MPRERSTNGRADLPSLEVELLLEALYRAYGFDFRQYARPSIRRRLQRCVEAEGLPTLTALQERLLHEPDCVERLLPYLLVNVSSMFRDAGFYRALREKVVPLLETYPFLRIWNAGCSSGEETLSMAILLHEHGLYERSRIYATDMNDALVEQAARATFPIAKMRDYTLNYIRSGGQRAFSEYYVANGAGARFHGWLTKNIVFAKHNLATDRSFNEFNVILCRNVLIYFDRALQDHVHGLLHESLAGFGILGLGRRESLAATRYQSRYEELDHGEKLYRRVR